MYWTQEFDTGSGTGRYRYLSPEAVDLVGLTAEQLIEEPEHFTRLVHPDDRARVQEGDARSEATGLWEDTYRIVRPDGSIRWVYAGAAASRTPTPSGACGTGSRST